MPFTDAASVPLQLSRTIACVTVCPTAAPTPCSMRQAYKDVRDVDKAAPTLAAAKRSIPPMRVGRLPRLSETLPATKLKRA